MAQMKASNWVTCTAILGLLTVLNFVAVQGQDCEGVLAGLAGSPTCANLQDNTKKVAPSAASGDCATVKAMLKTFTSLPTECCPALRTLVTSGCACNPTFPAVVAAMGGIANPADVGPMIKGSAFMIQEGLCSDEKFGGKIFNPCDGTTGVCSASRKLYY